MIITRNSAQTSTQRLKNVDEEVNKLTDKIVTFWDSEIDPDFFDAEDPTQTALKEEYVGFTETLSEIDNDYCAKAADSSTRLKFIKTAAGTTSPLPYYRLKEL